MGPPVSSEKLRRAVGEPNPGCKTVSPNQTLDLLTLNCKLSLQVVELLQGFTHPSSRVEMVVTLFSRVVDREGFWKVMYALEGWEQCLVFSRLGTSILCMCVC